MVAKGDGYKLSSVNHLHLITLRRVIFGVLLYLSSVTGLEWLAAADNSKALSFFLHTGDRGGERPGVRVSPSKSQFLKFFFPTSISSKLEMSGGR